MKREKWLHRLKQLLLTALLVAAATGIGILFQKWGFSNTTVVMIYLLSVILTACFTDGYVFGIIASVASTYVFGYFFTEPYYALSVKNSSSMVTLIILTLTALISSALTSKVKRTAVEAREQEAETSALFQLTNHLTDAEDISSIVSISVQTLSEALDCQAACLCFDENGDPETGFLQQKDNGEQIHRKLENGEEIKRRISGLHAEYDIGPEFYDWPIYGQESILGILRIPSQTAQNLSDTQKRFLHSVIESTALAMDRLRSVQAIIKSREEAEQERYRSNFLRAISHDLRTPLAGIMGASEMLMDMTDKEDYRYSLAEGIYRDADWLHDLVENILSLTRLQEGKLTLNKQMEPVEEIVGVAVMAVEKRETGREIAVSVPDSVLMVPMDAKLIEQVLINLLDNARKHTPLDKEIRVTVDTDENRENAVFTVSDQGTGISREDLPHIFEMFYTSSGKSADSQHGVGLGLTICESIVKAHGGTITAQNRTDCPGAIFSFTLPLEVQHDQTT